MSLTVICKSKLFWLLPLLIFPFLSWMVSCSVQAQGEAPSPEEVLEGRVVNVLEEQEGGEGEEKHLYQKLEILVTAGSLEGEQVTVGVGGNVSRIGEERYEKGSEVVLSRTKDLEGNDIFYITDFVRRKPLLWLFLIFAVLAAVVGKWRGVSSLLGMALSFLVIFRLILPQILAGREPILISTLGSLLIIPLTFYLSHGLNKKTTVAVFGTLISLIITGLLAKFFVGAAKLTGFASEEAAFLQSTKPGVVNIKGLLLAGVIVGVLGVLDDITVAQAAVVSQLRGANPSLKPNELFTRAMRVGQDHIASMVNTLVLVYAGAALPLLLLFFDNPVPFSQILNYEAIAEEIIRTLVGSIGLIVAVPVTTFLAANSQFSNSRG